MNKITAWYFSTEEKKLRYGDGRKIALGVEHTVKGYPDPCKHGLHASESLLDALQYAPGAIIWKVELSGRIKKGGNKIAATRRRYIAGGVDIIEVLRAFARKQALSVAHLWDMPAVVMEYLETGNEELRDAAANAAQAAAKAAANAAKAAAWDAAWAAQAAANAAQAAAQAAAWAAAWAAANDAANQMLTEMVEEAIK